MACVILGLEHIHFQGYIHRDIKPENIVFDSEGYAKITDFGISREWMEENHNDSSGTASYMAPEVLMKQNHSFDIDFYALGIMMFECIIGS